MNDYDQSVKEYIRIIKAHKIKVDSIVDIGAKDGFHAEMMAELLGLSHKDMYIVEPNPMFIDVIRKKYPEANLYCVAASNEESERDFYQVNIENNYDILGTSSLMRRDAWYNNPELKTKIIKVKSLKTKSIISKLPSINFALKIDVEGHSYEVLEGLEDLITSVCAIHVETEKNQMWDNQKTSREVDEFLQSKGFIKAYEKAMNLNNPNNIQYDQVWINSKDYKYSVDTYFDKVYYINMDKDTDRNQFMIDQFDKYGISNYQRIPGVKIDYIPEKIYWRNFNIDRLNEKYIKGQLGVRASHVNAVKHALSNGYKKVLIFEDDAEITLDINRLVEVNLKDGLNWDMLYFGGDVERFLGNQIILAHAYAVNEVVMKEILFMAAASGMEIDNFYAKILHHMTYVYNKSGKFDIVKVHPFNTIVQSSRFETNIQKK